MSFDDLHYHVELNRLDVHRLLDSDAQERYCFYRRHGHNPSDAYDAAIHWMENMIGQRIRRFSHDTGHGREEAPSRLPNRPGVGRRERRYLEGR